MNEHQERAERVERAQEAAKLLRNMEFDPLLEANSALSRARRAFDAITMNGFDAVEVVSDFMDNLAEVTTILDEVLVDMWEVLEPDDFEQTRTQLQEELNTVMGQIKQTDHEGGSGRREPSDPQWKDLPHTPPQGVGD